MLNNSQSWKNGQNIGEKPWKNGQKVVILPWKNGQNNVEEPTVPLILSSSRNLFKLFLSDIGLLASLYADGIQLKILENEPSINFGSVYENAVAQELHAHGFNLYYYNNKRQGELDFIIEQDGNVLPLEVKSGKDYERHKALSNVMNSTTYQIPKAYVLCNDNVKLVGKITYLPIYADVYREGTGSPNKL